MCVPLSSFMLVSEFHVSFGEGFGAVSQFKMLGFELEQGIRCGRPRSDLLLGSLHDVAAKKKQ